MDVRHQLFVSLMFVSIVSIFCIHHVQSIKGYSWSSSLTGSQLILVVSHCLRFPFIASGITIFLTCVIRDDRFVVVRVCVLFYILQTVFVMVASTVFIDVVVIIAIVVIICKEVTKSGDETTLFVLCWIMLNLSTKWIKNHTYVTTKSVLVKSCI